MFFPVVADWVVYLSKAPVLCPLEFPTAWIWLTHPCGVTSRVPMFPVLPVNWNLGPEARLDSGSVLS